MKRLTHTAWFIAVLLIVGTTGVIAQPTLGTRQLQLFDNTGTNALTLQAASSNYTLVLPASPAPANQNSLLTITSAASPWTMGYLNTSTTPGDVYTVLSATTVGFSQPFWFVEGNTFTGTITATGLGVAPAATTRWIGTNTATDFRIGTNNVIRGILSGTTGILSLQNDIFINSSGNGGNGVRVGRGAGTTPTTNTVVGDGSLSLNTSGTNNTAVGFNALAANTTGSFNSALGSGALALNVGGSNNTAMGFNALSTNVSGTGNTAVGSQALSLSTGNSNTAVGAWALQNATTGADSNVAVGAEALFNVTTGKANVALGVGAGRTITTGSRNIFIGPRAGTGEASTESDLFHLGGMQTSGTIHTPLLFGRLDLGRLWINPGAVDPAIPGATLHATSGNATTRPLVLRAAASQTADFLQAETNTGRVVFSINATGGLDYRPIPIVGGVQQTREFRLYDLDGDYVGFKAPDNIDAADARVWTLPGTYGAQGDYLTSNTAGVLQWMSGFIYPPYVYNNASNAGTTESPETFILGSIPDNPTNIALGLNQAANNTGVGFNVLKNLKTADDNTAVGHQALYTVTGQIGITAYGGAGGSRNVAIGKDAMYSADGAAAAQTNENVAVGASALYNLTSAIRNVAIGYEAMRFWTTIGGNVAVGWQALRSTSATGGTGTDNVAIGESAMTLITSGARNTAVGDSAAPNVTTATDVIAIGSRALRSTTTGGSNVAIGSNALYSAITAVSNVAIGSGALQRTTGSSNTAIGASAMTGHATTISTGASNTAIGTSALTNISSGANSNVAIGASALLGSTLGLTGSNNVAIGASSLSILNSGSQNIAIGSSALAAMVTGTGSTAIGFQAAQFPTGSSNTAVGNQALRGVTGSTAVNSVAVGAGSLVNITTGGSNTAVGAGGVGAAITTGASNVAIGTQALSVLTTGANNVAIGVNSMLYPTTAANNVAIGASALTSSTTVGLRLTGTGNVAVGSTTLNSLQTTASFNTAIGNEALRSATVVARNVAIGAGALRNHTTPGAANLLNSGNVAVGDSAAWSLTTGISNIAIGTFAMPLSTTGSWNTVVGDSALFFQTTGSSNVAIGKWALRGASTVGLTGSNNVGVGTNALTAIRTTAANNTGIGAGVLGALTTANGNVGIGSQAGGNNQTNSNKLYIANTAAAALIHGDFSTGRVMINATGMTTSALSAPTINAALDVRTFDPADRGLVIRSAAGATANAFEVQDNTGTVRFAISPSGNLSAINGVSYTWPTAAPAAAAAGQLGSGIMEVTNTGAMQWRQFVVVTANNLDFPNTDGQAVNDLDVAVVGAQIGDVVQLGTPVPLANTMYTAWVQADDLVRIRLHNYAAAGNFADPAAANFKITVMK
jgi:hypothetical protein